MAMKVSLHNSCNMCTLDLTDAAGLRAIAYTIVKSRVYVLHPYNLQLNVAINFNPQCNVTVTVQVKCQLSILNFLPIKH